ncbi:unnamed protein product [Pieris brassicae]|uniref:Uncharacterized protein n=1 Tax=Pieris brassicae TaxID=7116 RepID=A0A9P0TGF3_PIEBR|nr:unnamed protein product [Pieris brassicae]
MGLGWTAHSIYVQILPSWGVTADIAMLMRAGAPARATARVLLSAALTFSVALCEPCKSPSEDAELETVRVSPQQVEMLFNMLLTPILGLL